MTKTALLDEMQRQSRIKKANRERASQILEAIEGLRIWEARELLENCIGALQRLDVCYKETTPTPETKGRAVYVFKNRKMKIEKR